MLSCCVPLLPSFFIAFKIVAVINVPLSFRKKKMPALHAVL